MTGQRRRTAGGVLWRRTGKRRDAIEVAIVHRPRYDDWSWPKGGVEPGEHLLQTAARELGEETGQAVTLGTSLGAATYRHAGGETRVHWWSARPRDLPGPEMDTDEVDDVRWVSPEEALRLLTYRSDRAPLRKLITRPLPDAIVLLVRHASAGKRHEWHQRDDLRPLDPTGITQASRLADILTVFNPVSVSSAGPTRCVDTVAPLAAALGQPVGIDDRLAFNTWVKHPSRIVEAIMAAAKNGTGAGAAVLCSQGETIPSAITALAKRADQGQGQGLLPRSVLTGAGVPRARKGSVWVLAFARHRLVSADYLAELETT